MIDLFYTLFKVSGVIQIALLLIFYLLLKAKSLKRSKATQLPSVSLVICAKDAQNHLINNLPEFLNQQFSSYEVLVILHNSSDNSDMLLKKMQVDYEHLHVLIINDGKTGKKWALKAGLSKAKYDIIIATDADCKPSSSYWIIGLVNQFVQEELDVLVGYGAYNSGNSLVHLFAEHEAIITAAQYMAWAGIGIPYMGVGRNMVYKRKDFLSQDWDHQVKYSSGDDDLFIQNMNSKRKRIGFNYSTPTYCDPPVSFRQLISQKSRHLQPGKSYPRAVLFVLTIFSSSHMLTNSLGLLLLFTEHYLPILGIVFLRLIIMFFLTGIYSKKPPA